MTTWLVLIPTFPALAALVVLLLGRHLPRGGGAAATAGVGLSVLGLLVLAGSDVLHGAVLTAETTWVRVGTLELTAGLYLDGLSWLTALLVAAVCFLVTLYSVPYMAAEPDRPRFFALMAFFAASMLALVLSGSFVLLFMAWEGVGLCSFGLIAFHHRQDDARHAAQEAFLMTRLGDFGMLLGWLLVLVLVGTTRIASFQETVEGGAIPAATLTLLALLFFAAVVGKSAQLPLTAWLPEAMAGPAPVSALLHSATMVAAGVYLVLRLFPLFERAPYALAVVLGTGAATALTAALVATAQHDLKRILAWSTVSQLGEMMLALGLAGPVAAAFHLATHAVFKSVLFLAAGAIDRGAGSRDLRRLGGLWRRMPFTAGVFGAGALALAGFPPLAGFWSEEKILGAAQAHGWGWGLLMLALIFLAGVYISRAGMAAFGRWPGAPEPKTERPGRVMALPMLVLALGAIGLGLAIRTPIEQVLSFTPEAHRLGLWRWAAIAVSGLGLTLGVWRVRQAGPVPALGGFPRAFAAAVEGLARAPAQLAAGMASGTKPVEASLDAAARGLRDGVLAVGGASTAAEEVFDNAGRTTTKALLRLAQATDAAEAKGFRRGLDHFAYGFGRAGEWLRRLQSGQLYRYTLSVFAWVLAAVVLAVLLVWF